MHASRGASVRTIVRWAPPALALLAIAALWFLVDRWWPLLPLGYGPRWPWLFLIPVPALAGGGWRRAVAPTALTAVLVAWGLLGFRVHLLPLDANGSGLLRVVSFNAAARAEALAPLLSAASAYRADVVAVVECPDREAGPRPGYRLAIEGELCVWWRGETVPGIIAAPRDVERIGWSGTIAVIDVPGSGVGPIGVVHLRSVRNELEQFRDMSTVFGAGDSMEARHSKRIAGSQFASAWFRDHPTPPSLVVGDFNLVVESPRFRADWGWWTDSFEAIGTGTGATWRSRWYGLRIDHVLYRGPWNPVHYRRGADMGSDHRAVFVTFRRNDVDEGQ